MGTVELQPCPQPEHHATRHVISESRAGSSHMGGNSVLIQISKNKSLLFVIKEGSISLEKSIFLGRNKILENTCVTISGNLVNKDKTIHWEIKKNI